MVQLGSIEVESADVEAPGEPLMSLLVRLGVAPEGAPSVADLPFEGWRPLVASPGVSPLIGAPTTNGEWVLAELRGAGSRPVFVPMPAVRRYPSRAERRAGLSLRWPAAVRDVSIRHLFVDIVNKSDRRWIPALVDHFQVAGRLTRADQPASNVGWYCGWVAGSERAFPLDPGEYARVPVSVQGDDIVKLGSGEVLVHANVIALDLVSATPLRVAISAHDIAEQERRNSRRPSPPPS